MIAFWPRPRCSLIQQVISPICQAMKRRGSGTLPSTFDCSWMKKDSLFWFLPSLRCCSNEIDCKVSSYVTYSVSISVSIFKNINQSMNFCQHCHWFYFPLWTTPLFLLVHMSIQWVSQTSGIWGWNMRTMYMLFKLLAPSPPKANFFFQDSRISNTWILQHVHCTHIIRLHVKKESHSLVFVLKLSPNHSWTDILIFRKSMNWFQHAKCN